jgi:hypothetical protein
LPLLTRAGLAQTPSVTRIHGTITALKRDTLAVQTTGGKAVSVAYGPKTNFIGIAAASFADIKPGSFVGSAARPGPDGTLVALEVHIFPESLRGTGEGHRPFDMGPGSTMTNGTVGSGGGGVTGIAGNTITINYAGGAKTVTVPKDVPVVRFEVATRALLMPGAHVSIIAAEAPDGMLTANRIAVGEHGLTPPI